MRCVPMAAVGENSGKSSRSTAQLTAGPGAVALRTGAAMSEIERAKLVSSLIYSCFQSIQRILPRKIGFIILSNIIFGWCI